jgi:DNA-directed RNA polymerases I, II, and III subunit RPABC2
MRSTSSLSSTKNKQSKKLTQKTVKSKSKKAKKEELTESNEEINLDTDTLNEEEEERFFNKDSYNYLIDKYDLQSLNPDNYIHNDIHKEEIIVPKEYRTSSEIMTHAEYTRIKSERAKQIENGSIKFVDVADESDPVQIAIMEIKQKKCPMSIIRYVSNDKLIKEIWEVNEMIIPFK